MNNEPLNDLEASIILILEEHQGQGEAISREVLVRQVCDLQEFEISERTIRQTLKHLIVSHGIAIASCHRGYFLVQNFNELNSCCHYFHNYALSLLFVESKLRKQHISDLLGQMALDLRG